MKIKFKILSATLLIGLLVSCSDYQQIVKGDDYEDKFLHANAMYEKGSYTKALTLYEQIYQRFPKTDKGEVAYYRLGKSYFEMEDYYMAGYYFNQFTQRYPLSEKAEEATFLMAICSVKNSPSPSLDQEETDLALNDLQMFVQRYPNSDLIDSCNRTMDRLRLKLETKKFESVKLYDRMERNRAAVAASQSFLDDYPRSTFLKEAAYIQFKNYYHLAMRSILSKKKDRIENAMESYAKYSYLFEGENYEKRTKKYNDELLKELDFVAERYAYKDIVEAYEMSRSSSKRKKVNYLEETLKRFNNFAEKYPNSQFMDKAKFYQRKAEKELINS